MVPVRTGYEYDYGMVPGTIHYCTYTIIAPKVVVIIEGGKLGGIC